MFSEVERVREAFIILKFHSRHGGKEVEEAIENGIKQLKQEGYGSERSTLIQIEKENEALRQRLNKVGVVIDKAIKGQTSASEDELGLKRSMDTIRSLITKAPAPSLVECSEVLHEALMKNNPFAQGLVMGLKLLAKNGI